MPGKYIWQFLRRYFPSVCIFLFFATAQAQSDGLIERIAKEYGGIPAQTLEEAEKYEVQIIYTQIDRNKRNIPTFKTHTFRLNDDHYYYPASTVKFPAAILTLEKLKRLNLNKYYRVAFDSAYSGQIPLYVDSTAENFQPTLAHFIKKILLVSDNDAFNRLYEFLGREALNDRLHELGYDHSSIVHRLERVLTETENRYTNPLHLFNATKEVYAQGLVEGTALPKTLDPILRGKGELIGGVLSERPKDFATKNRLPLGELHNMLLAIMFPKTLPPAQRFDLSKDDYLFLRKYMSQLPRESAYPHYKQPDYYDSYVKFLMYGDSKDTIPASIRIFNKVGIAYGYTTDCAYIVDFENNIEFILAATIYTNEDGIFNDNQYEYDEVAFPFMAELGRAIYAHEKMRKRNHVPNLKEFAIDSRDR